MHHPARTRRRRQRRRATIAWAAAALFIAFLVLAIVSGGEKKDDGEQPHGGFGYTMTADKYNGLRRGMPQNEVLDRVGGSGVPEYLMFRDYREAFPPPPEDSLCSFWEISDRFGYLARICFSDPEARLVEKLQRNASGEEFGTSA